MDATAAGIKIPCGLSYASVSSCSDAVASTQYPPGTQYGSLLTPILDDVMLAPMGRGLSSVSALSLQWTPLSHLHLTCCHVPAESTISVAATAGGFLILSCLGFYNCLRSFSSSFLSLTLQSFTATLGSAEKPKFSCPQWNNDCNKLWTTKLLKRFKAPETCNYTCHMWSATWNWDFNWINEVRGLEFKHCKKS